MEKELSAYKINEGLEDLAVGYPISGTVIGEGFLESCSMAPIKTVNGSNMIQEFHSRKKLNSRKIFTYEHKGKYTRLFRGGFFCTSEKLETPKWKGLNKG